MKKIKNSILEIKLSSFDIKPLTNWVARRERRWHRKMAQIRELAVGRPPEETERELRMLADKQIQTVGCLVRNYPYRFVSSWCENGDKYLVGLGHDPIAQLKKKLVALGVTPDHWPALVEHGELLENLSKTVILELPFSEVFPIIKVFSSGARCYFQCGPEELSQKTVRDFIEINPLEIQNLDGFRFFERHQHKLVALRQKLVAKGCGTRDGAFFKWNPEKKSLAKADKLLKKYELPDDVRQRFGKILVAERLVV